MSYRALESRADDSQGKDGPLPPNGQVASDIISQAQAAGGEGVTVEQIASLDGESPTIKIGPLSDPDSACTIVLARSQVGSEIRESTLIFRSALISELLWGVGPGEKGKATVIGEGVYYPHAQLENGFTAVAPTSSRDQLTLIMELSEDLTEVTISYVTQSLVPGKLTFKKPAE